MKAVFCDTFFFLAAINRHDKCHEEALGWSNAYDGPLLTRVWVITEVADALASLENRRMFKLFHQTLAGDKRIRIITADQSLWERGLSLYFQRPDKEWSLTDCISFAVMKDEGLADALTGDRHFEQAGLKVLLRVDPGGRWHFISAPPTLPLGGLDGLGLAAPAPKAFGVDWIARARRR
jgi:uncharacterized protein